MTLQSEERAPRVCNHCRARKKGCDKHLPICGYCQSKGLSCSYELPTWSPGSGIGFPTSHQSVPFSLNLASSLPLLAPKNNGASQLLSHDGDLYQQACNVLRLSGLTLPEASERYFETFHCWFPIVSSETFNDTAAAATRDASAPPDFSVLLLAICLITLDSAKAAAGPDGSPGHYLTKEEFLASIKLLFAHVQSTITASVRLLQAGLLIAICEFAGERPQAAWITLGNCVRIAFALGLNETTVLLPDLLDETLFSPSAEEARNAWWGTLILERFVSTVLTPCMPRNI
ncbi:MAG: Zn(II)2Cys6 transcription factor [Terriglobus roseus]|nr:Zn(II)2Cys6 transcription factor [Terriglobus roseus]